MKPHGIAPGRPAPLARSAFRPALPTRKAPRPRPLPSLVDQSARTIMVISPDPYCRALLGNLLRGDGYEVTTRPGIEPSPSGLAPENCDCLIIDIDLPDSELVAQDLIDLADRMRGTLPVVLIANRSSWVPAQLGIPSVSKHARRARVLRGVRKTLFAG